MIDKTVYYVLTYNRSSDDYQAEPRRGNWDSWNFRLDADPRTDPVAEGAPSFSHGIYGRWPGAAAGHLRRKVGAHVQVWARRADPRTGHWRYWVTG